ncbi:YcxB family protein [Paenibacillus sp. BC26]|uniref:YcxB family protein n=1 Tax=Paenibacillus sp. BC26 TaxID=1881032 RepID=UPI0008E6C730|nr:YcxB family protein [Paenibacillus sp. BC26]SFS77289.1 YcxB-like protein [Paenibacillus sp. BC26]
MKINFMYSEREIISAINQNLNLKELIFSVLIAAALLVYGIFQLMSGSTRIFDVFILLISILFFFIVFVRIIVVPRIVFKRQPKFKEEYVLSFNEENIIFNAGDINSTISWDFYKEIKESKEFIFLKYGKELHTIIPKRVFRNKEELNEFKTLIKSKINKRI